MAEDFTVTGADDFYRLSKALKAAGRSDLRKELNKALRVAAKPLIAQTRAAALRELPRRGGLAARVAKAPQVVQVRTGAQTAGVRIGVKGQGITGSNRGVVRHPVFGDRSRFVDQTVDGGWFDDTLKAGAPTVLPGLEAALETIANKVIEEAR